MTYSVLPNVKISSFAAPSDEDIAAFGALTDEEKRAVLHAELDKAKASGASERSIDDIWHEALRRAGQLPDHAV